MKIVIFVLAGGGVKKPRLEYPDQRTGDVALYRTSRVVRHPVFLQGRLNVRVRVVNY